MNTSILDSKVTIEIYIFVTLGYYNDMLVIIETNFNNPTKFYITTNKIL